MDFGVITVLYACFLLVDYRRVIKKGDKVAVIFSGALYAVTFVLIILVLAGVKIPSPWQWLLDFFYGTLGFEKPHFGI